MSINPITPTCTLIIIILAMISNAGCKKTHNISSTANKLDTIGKIHWHYSHTYRLSGLDTTSKQDAILDSGHTYLDDTVFALTCIGKMITPAATFVILPASIPFRGALGSGYEGIRNGIEKWSWDGKVASVCFPGYGASFHSAISYDKAKNSVIMKYVTDEINSDYVACGTTTTYTNY